MDNVIKYDIIVIGGGGGANIVKEARRKGLKVAIVEKSKLGGTCLNRGCIPSKMLIHPADIALEIKESKKFGINAKYNSVNFKQLINRISNTVDSESDSLSKTYKKLENVDFYHLEGKFESDKIIKVGKKRITSNKIIIATGARPSIPPISGLKDTPFWTSTDALRSVRLPKRLLVIGGGYIAVELGHAYSGLGSNVNFLVRGAMVSREDKEVIDTFTRIFKEKHNVLDINTIENVSYKNKEFTLTYTTPDNKKKTIKGDALLVATGVKPNTDNLGLENTKIKTNKFGFIQVDKYMETPIKGVYAIGDCVGNYLFRHSVNFETEYLNPILLDKAKKVPIKYVPIPHSIFTNPQIAGVGLTEEELIAKKIPYVVGLNKYKNSAMGMALLEEDGFVKLLFHKKTKKLLGAHIIGPEASDMIHMLIYAITFNATVDSLLKMVYVHPALPEIVRNAARIAKSKF